MILDVLQCSQLFFDVFSRVVTFMDNHPLFAIHNLIQPDMRIQQIALNSQYISYQFKKLSKSRLSDLFFGLFLRSGAQII